MNSLYKLVHTCSNTTSATVIAIVTFLTIGAPISGCASTEYYGESFPETSHVDLFWDNNDVNKHYTVIGRAITTEGFGDSEEMIQSIREEAMKRGAHGVIITKLDSVVTGESETGKADDNYRHTNITREQQIESKFIRYSN